MNSNPTPDLDFDTTPETARALLWRHGLPEDVIDGALALFAQELAGKIRAHRDHTRGAVQATKVMDFAADLISPERWARTVPAVPSVSAVDQTTRDRITEALAPFFANFSDWETARINAGEATAAVLAVLLPPADRAAVLREAADWLSMDWGGPDHDEGMDEARKQLRRLADEAQQPEPDDEGDELVCVDECGSCDACGMEPFGTPAEGWREAARFLRRTARESGDRQGALHGARLIEAELRRVAEEARDEQEAQTHLDQLADELPAVGARQPDTETPYPATAAAAAPCSAVALRKAHVPHHWKPQPGMDYVLCPGASGWEHPSSAASAVPGRSAATSTDEETRP